MIPIFNKLLDLLGTVEAIRWTDLDKGQIDNFKFRPPIAFPCALIRINVTRTEDLGGGVQRCTCSCNIRLAFDYEGDTNSHVPATVLQNSVDYFNTVEDVFKAIHYQGGKEIGKFMRKAQTQEIRPDGLTIMNMPFDTVFIDRSAAV